MFTTLHKHLLEQVNPLEVYRACGGRWKCDHCNSESGIMGPFPFHCRMCSFDLCYSCMYMQHPGSNLIHQHLLHYMDTSRVLDGGIWSCNVCKKTSDALSETFSYHCLTCRDFDVCRSCNKPKRHPIHIHELRVVDTSLIHVHTGGNRVCKSCRKPCEVLCHRCYPCDFVVCNDCLEPCHSILHEHPLYRTDADQVYAHCNGEWHCSSCHCGPLDNMVWHCHQCLYNLCENCISVDVEGAAARVETPITNSELDGSIELPGPSSVPQNISPPLFGSGQSHQLVMDRKEQKIMELKSRVSELEKENKKIKTEYEIEKECIVCRDKKREVVFIHEDSTVAHNVCCSECASKLDYCPLCRSKIRDHIMYI